MCGHQVNASGVNIYLLAERGVDHCGALNVPTGKTLAPRAIPPDLFSARGGSAFGGILPKQEVGGMMFLDVGRDPRALLQALYIDTAQFSIVRKSRRVEVDPVLRAVCISLFLQRFYERDLSLNMLRCTRKQDEGRIDIQELQVLDELGRVFLG